MSSRLRVDLFCEDRAHEELLSSLVRRLCTQEEFEPDIAIRSARGGHGRALQELGLYQSIVTAQGRPFPDLLVVAIDTNCRSYVDVVREVETKLDTDSFPHYAIACPNPHIELWYMADAAAFEEVVGAPAPRLQQECGKQARNVLKRALADSVRAAGHPVLLGGMQFARELAAAMDLFAAGKVDTGLHHFVRDVRKALRQVRESGTSRRPGWPS